MSIAAPDGSDVPGFFDVVFTGSFGTGGAFVQVGFCFLRTIDTSLPFRTQRANYTRTPTFLARQNVSGAYSDNQQDFFLTASQNDWSLGEQQRFAHVSVPDTMRKAWRLDNTKVSTQGQVSLLDATGSIAFAGTQYTVASTQVAAISALATASTLYMVSYGGINTSNVHGLGVTPLTSAYDGKYAYLSATTAGTVGVRKGDATTSLATFSATASDVLAFHNNSLYGIVNSTGILQVYSTAGVAATLYQWKRPDGTAAPQTFTSMVAWGGKLLMAGANQLWQYDGGAAPTLLAEFPSNFRANLTAQSSCMVVVDGIVLVGGHEYRQSAPARPVVYAYTNGSIAKLWTSTGTLSNAYVRMAAFDGGAVWNDDATSRIMYWDPATGAVNSLFAYSGPGPLLAANYTQLLVAGGANSGVDALYYSANSTATTGSVTSSLYDFDNALTKLVRGIKVDFSSATDGNGGTIDIAYRVDDVDGAYTTLQAGAVSGTEYPITGVSGRSVSVKATLNKGTSTSGPLLKRVYVRAAPLLQSYRMCDYIFDLSGRDGDSHVILNDNETSHPLDGLAQALLLAAAIAATAPFTTNDRFGGYTSLTEPGQCDIIEVAPEEYIARIRNREV